MGPKGCPETSVRNYHYTLCYNPEERRSQWWYVFFTYQIPPHPIKLVANLIFDARCIKTKSSSLSVLIDNKETGPYINYEKWKDLYRLTGFELHAGKMGRNLMKSGAA
jgi:hypothetical protein